LYHIRKVFVKCMSALVLSLCPCIIVVVFFWRVSFVVVFPWSPAVFYVLAPHSGMFFGFFGVRGEIKRN